MLACVAFDEVECAGFDEVEGVGVTAESSTAYRRSGWIAAAAAVRRSCAKLPIPDQVLTTAKLEIAPTATAAAIPITLRRMGEK